MVREVVALHDGHTLIMSSCFDGAAFSSRWDGTESKRTKGVARPFPA